MSYSATTQCAENTWGSGMPLCYVNLLFIIIGVIFAFIACVYLLKNLLSKKTVEQKHQQALLGDKELQNKDLEVTTVAIDTSDVPSVIDGELQIWSFLEKFYFCSTKKWYKEPFYIYTLVWTISRSANVFMVRLILNDNVSVLVTIGFVIMLLLTVVAFLGLVGGRKLFGSRTWSPYIMYSSYSSKPYCKVVLKKLRRQIIITHICSFLFACSCAAGSLMSDYSGTGIPVVGYLYAIITIYDWTWMCLMLSFIVIICLAHYSIHKSETYDMKEQIAALRDLACEDQLVSDTILTFSRSVMNMRLAQEKTSKTLSFLLVVMYFSIVILFCSTAVYVAVGVYDHSFLGITFSVAIPSIAICTLSLYVYSVMAAINIDFNHMFVDFGALLGMCREEDITRISAVHMYLSALKKSVCIYDAPIDGQSVMKMAYVALFVMFLLIPVSMLKSPYTN